MYAFGVRLRYANLSNMLEKIVIFGTFIFTGQNYWGGGGGGGSGGSSPAWPPLVSATGGNAPGLPRSGSAIGTP